MMTMVSPFIDRKANSVENGSVPKLAHEVADFDDGIIFHLSPAPAFPRLPPVLSLSNR